MKLRETKKIRSKDSDMRGAEAALLRAAQRAKERAEAHGLKVLVYKKSNPTLFRALIGLSRTHMIDHHFLSNGLTA